MAVETHKSVQKVCIRQEIDVLRTRKVCVDVVRDIGYTEIERAEIEIIISELGMNIVKHSPGGVITMQAFRDGIKEGVEIVARNQKASRALNRDHFHQFQTDGYSTTGTLGIGLPGVKRLADEFDMGLDDAGALQVTVRKYIQKTHPSRLQYSIISRPRLAEKHSGDAYVIRPGADFFFWGVIDALGHGPEAGRTAEIARQEIESQYNKPLSVILDHCHDGLKGARGAAVSLGRLDFTQNRLEHVSIGNIVTRIFGNEKISQPITYSGTLGLCVNPYRVMAYPYQRGWVITVNTDGVSDKFDLTTEMHRKPVQELTNYIMCNFGRTYDDATILVMK